MAKLAINGGTPLRTRPWPVWPEWDEREVEAVAAVVRSGRWGGFPEPGPKAAEFAERFAAFQGAKYGIAMANGTVTLSVALQACGIGWGDEVLVPGCTFAATATAVLAVGAVPIIVDVDPETFCLDVDKARAAINERTRAIIPVHLAMSMADEDALMALASEHNLVVIEDCAHAHGVQWNGRGAGSFGHFGSFSLQSGKLLTSGEGGILITNDRKLAEAAHSIIDCGRPKDAAGREYHLGTNYRITELQAALLCAQMDRLEGQIARRIPNVAYLDAQLSQIDGIRVQKAPAQVGRRNGFNYLFVFDRDKFSGIDNATFCQAMAAEGMPAADTGYEAMNDYTLFRPTAQNSPVVAAFGSRMNLHTVSLPVSEMLGKAAVWLEHYAFLGTKEDMDDIAAIVRKVRENAWELG